MVSVIIPTFNRAAFVVQAVDSVLAQTYTNYEVLVVDDGSTDGTMARLAPYRGRITILSQARSERAAARNCGIRNARGCFIAFLDSDDVWRPTKLADDMALFSQCPDAGLIYCGAELINGEGRMVGRPTMRWFEGKVCEHLLYSNFIANSSAIVRRDCLEMVGYLTEDRELSGSEDWELWVRLAAQFPVKVVRRYNVQRRSHRQNTLHNPRQMEQSMLRAWALIKRNPSAAPILAGQAHRIEAVIYRYIAIGYYGVEEMAAARQWLRRALARDLRQGFAWRWLITYVKSFVPRTIRGSSL